MKIADTSSWVHQTRPKGDLEIRARVESLLRDAVDFLRERREGVLVEEDLFHDQ